MIAPDPRTLHVKGILARLGGPLPTQHAAPSQWNERVKYYAGNYVLNAVTGLFVLGPIVIGAYFAWWFINVVDAWIIPLVLLVYEPDPTVWPDPYLAYFAKGVGLSVVVFGLPKLGALGAKLWIRNKAAIEAGKTSHYNSLLRDLLRGALRRRRSAGLKSGLRPGVEKVGLIEFPSNGLWSVVLVGSEAVQAAQSPEAEERSELLAVLVPTSVAPLTGFTCFVPRDRLTILDTSVEGLLGTGEAFSAAG